VQEPPAAKLMSVLQVHEGCITQLALLGTRLFVGSTHGTVHVWDIVSGLRDAILVGHDAGESGVTSLVVSRGKVFCASENGTLKVWTAETLKCRTVLIPGAAPFCRRGGVWQRIDRVPIIT
jgi:WD40 repeat protein